MMRRVGIDAVGVYAGRAMLDVSVLAMARGLDMTRFQNLLMRRKSVALPVEDPVSFAVNAGKVVVDQLSTAERGVDPSSHCSRPSPASTSARRCRAMCSTIWASAATAGPSR